jgi:tRNA(Ile2) C34 agmatinyltransferase TiaS
MIYDECPMCGTSNAPMGQLGDRLHYRCRDCGVMYYETLEDITGEEGADE